MSSLKNRVEQTFVNLLRSNALLAKLNIYKENEDDKVKLPYILVKAAPTREYEVNCGIYEIEFSIEIHYEKKSGKSANFDSLIEQIYAVLQQAQALGVFGVTRESDSERFDQTKAIYLINSTLIAA